MENELTPQNSIPQEGEDIEFDENVNIEDIQKILQQHMDESAALEAEKAQAQSESTENEAVAENSTEIPLEQTVEEPSLEAETSTGSFEEEEDNESSETENSDVADNQTKESYDDDEEDEVESFNDISIESTESMSQIAFQVSQQESFEINAQAKKYVIYIDPENVDFMENLSINERKTIINTFLKERDALIKKQKREEEVKQYLRHSIVAALTVIVGFPMLFIMVNKSLEITIDNYRRSQQNFAKLYREQGKIKQSKPTTVETIKY